MGEFQYLLLDRIAVGGMAEVFRAKSVGVAGFEKLVAIKRILPQLSDDEEFVQMFVEEAKIAGRLRHANIARILELGKIQGTLFIAMEYVFGKDLLQIKKHLAERGEAAPPKMAAWVISNVLAGLDYAHRQRGADGSPLGLIHRDVSPQNILVSHDGLVKLIDFGIAKAASRATQTVAGVIKGKLGYMSPEQILGRTIDHRSDIFAASTCLHEILTGERLFTKSNDLETLEAVRAAAAPPPSSINPAVPPELDAIVMKGLAREPDDRWPTAGEMQDALIMFLMSSKPAFGAAQLREWMRSTFESDVATQSAHLDHLAEVSEAGMEVTAPESEDDMWDDEPTTVGMPEDFAEDYVELSSLVVIEDLVDRFSMPSPAPAEIVRVGQSAGLAPVKVVAAVSAAPAMPTTQILPQPGPAPEPISTPSPAPVQMSRPSPAPEQMRASPAPAQMRVSPAPEYISRPSPGPGYVSRPAAAPVPEEDPDSIRWGALFGVALVALLLGVGSVVLWLFLTGRELPFDL